MRSLAAVRRTGDDLPEDVWRDIISFLPTELVLQMISVNRTFFNVALDMKYREVAWTKLDNGFLNILHRLQSHVIAVHVRKLCIRAWFVDYLFKRDALPKGFGPGKAPDLGFLNTFSRVLTKRRGPFVERRSQCSSTQILDKMNTAIRGMSQLIELQFEWRDLPLTKDTRVFLTETRSAFDKTLRKLTLQAQILKFKELLLITNFACLQELDFHFDYQTSDLTTSKSNSQEQTQLLETILPFINHRRTILRSLAISSSSTVDLSDFFVALPTMPCLQQFGVNINFDLQHFSDFSGLIRFLKANSHHLLHVHLSAVTPITVYDRKLILQQKQAAWAPVNKGLLAEPSCLTGLYSLELPFISLDDTLPLVRRSSDTLASLCLTDHFLTPQEAPVVIGLFDSRPFEVRHVHLGVDVLQGSFIRLLANRLPNLSSLVLVYRQCPCDLDDLLAHGKLYVPFSDWKLNDIGLYEGRYLPLTADTLTTTHVTYAAEMKLMRRVSYAVPSIRRWKGFAKEHF